ncbi:MAG: DUF2064 domain-containing protein [Planctomycetales bacterium]
MTTLGLFVRLPVPGLVKTRLAAALGAERAAEAYTAFVHELVERFQDTAGARVLCYTPATDDSRAYFAGIAHSIVAREPRGAGESQGDTGGGRQEALRSPGQYEVWPQPAGALGERLDQFFAERLRRDGDRVVVIGSDSPTLPREFVEQAFELLDTADVVLGPATDGGYYLVGQRGRDWPIFEGIDWSTPRVLQQTVARVVQSGARLALLPPWYDVDTPEDWQLLAGHIQALLASGEEVSVRLRPLIALA